MMKVSKAKIKVTEKDIIGILNEFLDIEGLKIDKIAIDDIIKVYGSYGSKIKVPFAVEVGLGRVKNNIVTGTVFKIDVFKVAAFKGIAKVTLKSLLKKYTDLGIELDKDYFYIDLDVISKYIPFVYFKVDDIIITKGEIEVYAESIIYSQNKPVKTLSEAKKDEDKVEKRKIKKYVDEYSEIREKITMKVPKKLMFLKEYIMLVPDIIMLLYRLLKDERVAIKTKIILCAVVMYIISPVNLILENIPVIGEIDDIAIIFLAFETVSKDIPEEVVLENWQGEIKTLNKAKEGIQLVKDVLGDRDLKSIFKFIKKRKKKTK